MQLPRPDDALLSLGQRHNRSFDSFWAGFVSHTETYPAHNGFSPLWGARGYAAAGVRP